eukprot:453886-Hanusia_phi.AAC.1
MADLGWRVEQRFRDLTDEVVLEDEDKLSEEMSDTMVPSADEERDLANDEGLSSDTVSNPDLKQRDSPRTNPDLNHRDICRESPQKRNPFVPPRLPFPLASSPSFLPEETLELVHGSAGSAQAVLFFRMASMESGGRAGGKATFFGIHFRQVGGELLVTDTVARWIRAVKSEKLAVLFERLRSGYKLESVNGLDIHAMDLNSLYCMFRGKPGCQVKLSFTPVEPDVQKIRTDDMLSLASEDSPKLTLIYLVSEKASRSSHEPSSPTSRGDDSFDSIRDAFLKRDRELERLRRTNDSLCLRIREMEEEGQDLVLHVEKEMDRLVSKVCDSWQLLEHQLSKEALCTVRAEKTLDHIEHNMELIRAESQKFRKTIEKLQAIKGTDLDSTREEGWKEINEARLRLKACEIENQKLKTSIEEMNSDRCNSCSKIQKKLQLIFIFVMCLMVPLIATLEEYHSRQTFSHELGIRRDHASNRSIKVCEMSEFEYHDSIFTKSEEIHGELRWKLASRTFCKPVDADSIFEKLSELHDDAAVRVKCLDGMVQGRTPKTSKELNDCKKIRDSLSVKISALTSQSHKDSLEYVTVRRKLELMQEKAQNLESKLLTCQELTVQQNTTLQQMQSNISGLTEQNRNLSALLKTSLKENNDMRTKDLKNLRHLASCKLDMIASQREWENALQQIAQLTQAFHGVNNIRGHVHLDKHMELFRKHVSYCGLQKFKEDEPPLFHAGSECSISNEGLNSMFLEIPLPVCAQVPMNDKAAFASGCLPGHIPIIYNDKRFFSR